MKFPTSRRRFLELTTAVTGALAGWKRTGAQEDEGPRMIGQPLSKYGERSAFEKSARSLPTTKILENGSSLTPLQDSCGIITPSALHYGRHHAGVPAINPAEHRLLIHGLVERPLIFTMDEIRRLPSISRIYFLECSGNSRDGWGAKPAPSVQLSHGMVSCSEWTGVPLSLLLSEAGVRPAAKWILAEGADACKMQRSIPLEKAMNDILLAYGQNGEALRPEQGYPLRLVVPGWEGNTHVKWLRRLKVGAAPAQTREETAKYTDLLPDGTARQFTFVMEAKSVITFPSGGQRLPGPGRYELRGLAWSGRGAVRTVEVSTDGGRRWQAAELQAPVLPIAHTRFRLPWRWDGRDALLQSRCTDETGYVQPTLAELSAVRGLRSHYHQNAIQSWKVAADGRVSNVHA